MSRKKTTDEFINESKKIHKDKYIYSMVEYVNNFSNVTIICPNHGEFLVTPNSHLSKKSGCPTCAGKNKTTDTFIHESRLIHGDKYDYSKTIYNGIDNDVIIICPNHGEFLQRAYTHKTGGGCSECRNINFSEKYRDTIDNFIKKSKLIHGDKYSYQDVVYFNQRVSVNIHCYKHGIFQQIPYSHLQGRGCPICRESKGERKIRLWLNENKIKFVQQYKFNDCVNINTGMKLPFDFYIPDKHICIEYQGIQHFTIKNGGFGANPEKTLKNFERLKLTDEIKKEYCLNNKISLIEITYLDNVDKILNKKLK
jgi:hypothetical protein